MKQPQDSTGPIRPSKKAQKRSSVKELVGALVAAGVDKDKIVIERDSDGTLRVLTAPKLPKRKMTDLEIWKQQNASST